MEVRHGFAGVRTVVHDEAEAVIEFQFLRDSPRDEEQVAEHGLIGGNGGADSGDRLFRYDQQVNGRLGLDVVEDDAVLILVFDPGGNFPGDDAFEDRFGHGAEITTKHTKHTKEDSGR